MSSNTIVTACDANYWWGAFLLVASIRKQNQDLPIHVLCKGFEPSHVRQLEQFGNLKCIPTETPHAMYQKPEAMLTADTDLVTWLDADCFWMGDLTPLLEKTGRGCQIRLRGVGENNVAFSTQYRNGDRFGTIPASTLARWQRDIGERDEPRIHTMGVGNAICLHRDFRWVMERWRTQMEAVALNPAILVDKNNPDYYITDEAVLTSILAYCNDDVSVTPYYMDKEPERFMIHFEGRPKPWNGWQLRFMPFFNDIVDAIQWARERDLEMPPVPQALQREHRSQSSYGAHYRNVKSAIRKPLAETAKRILR